MQVGYVVLYVQDPEASRAFWVDKVGMAVRKTSEANGHAIRQVGFEGQDFAFELVPLAMMKENPDGLDLATPSVCFRVDDLAATRARLVGRGVQASELSLHFGTPSFAFCDPEGHWYAVAP